MVNRKDPFQNFSNEEINNILQKNELLEHIISILPGHVYWKDLDCVMQGSNDNQAIDVGLSSREEIIGKREYDIVSPNLSEKEKIRQADIIEAIDKKVMQTGCNSTIEEEFEYPDGAKTIFLSEKIPLKDKIGQVKGLVGISIDISQLKKLEQQIIENAKTERKLQTERLKSLKALAASIAHELRTPLATINLGAQSIEKYLPTLLDTYQLAKENNLTTNSIRPNQLLSLKEVLTSIQKESQMANTIINMLLMNLRETGIDRSKFEKLSIKTCISDALNRYPFKSKHETTLIHFDSNNDFCFFGDKIYFTHVLFNLIKNALYYIEKANKGEIKIVVTANESTNQLSFTDTGSGIPMHVLPMIFDNFFTSKEKEGTGVGLSFCQSVMKAFRGNITCQSEESIYTEFLLTFPKPEMLIGP